MSRSSLFWFNAPSFVNRRSGKSASERTTLKSRDNDALQTRSVSNVDALMWVAGRCAWQLITFLSSLSRLTRGTSSKSSLNLSSACRDLLESCLHMIRAVHAIANDKAQSSMPLERRSLPAKWQEDEALNSRTAAV